MKEQDVLQKILDSSVMSSWHWFQWHFQHQKYEKSHPFSEAIIKVIAEIDDAIPGYADNAIKSLSSISGSEKFVPHYEQLLQLLSEMHVIRQAITHPWPDLTGFSYEPVAAGSNKNPEISVNTASYEIGIEVKAPSLIAHVNQRQSNPTQIAGRAFERDAIENFPNSDQGITYPRDNPIKDFLVSANNKFQSFKDSKNDFYGLLVIVWDDHVFEPITALLHEHGGLFTENSFHKDGAGNPVEYKNVDGVVIIRHLHQLMRSSRDEPFADNCRWTFDYGIEGQFPYKALIVNPSGSGLPENVSKAFQAHTPTSEMGAEYTPKELIWWLNV